MHDLQNSATLVELQRRTASMQSTGASTRKWWQCATAGAAPHAELIGMTANVEALLGELHMRASQEDGGQTFMSSAQKMLLCAFCLSSSL